jgi:phospholipid/cholesterol/gamma-HCH transport system substrate-binding protein
MRRRRPAGSTARPFAIGVIGLFAIAAIAYAAFATSSPFSHPYTVDAIFADSGQLRAGSPVRIAGIDVGQVSSVSAGPGTTAEVQLQIDGSGLPIHTDATATIRPRVFLEGGFYVDLGPGSPSAPVLDSGGTIPRPQTAVPVQFDQILSTLTQPRRQALRRIVAQTNKALAGGGAQGFRETTAHLPPALRDLAMVSLAARGTRPHDLSRLISSAARATGQLAERDTALADLVTNANRTAAALVAHPGALGATEVEIDRLLRAAPRALDSIDRVVPRVNAFTAALRPANRLVPGVIRRLHALAAELRGIGTPSSETKLISGLRPVLRNVPSFSLLSRGLFPLAGPIVSCLRDNVMPTLRSQVDDGALSSGRPVWQDFLHSTVGLASASQNFDANGPWFRYLGAVGPGTVSTGSVPGVGQLFGTSPQPLLGSRPVWLGPGKVPPFRPDAPCAKQTRPDLSASTGPAQSGPPGHVRAPNHLGHAALRRLLAHPAIRDRHAGSGS